MPIEVVEEKMRQLPESYILLINEYVDKLLTKHRKIDALKGCLNKYANPELREKEKEAWVIAAAEKYKSKSFLLTKN